MAIPKPGKPVRGSATGRPIMALLDLLGRRWTLRIIWELRENTLNFRQLQQACGEMSPSVLNQRLHELKKARIVSLKEEGGYLLTDEGQDLLKSLMPLNDWAERWAKREKR